MEKPITHIAVYFGAKRINEEKQRCHFHFYVGRKGEFAEKVETKHLGDTVELSLIDTKLLLPKWRKEVEEYVGKHPPEGGQKQLGEIWYILNKRGAFATNVYPKSWEFIAKWFPPCSDERKFSKNAKGLGAYLHIVSLNHLKGVAKETAVTGHTEPSLQSSLKKGGLKDNERYPIGEFMRGRAKKVRKELLGR
ncbi:hypothetical protein HZC09_04690 [Candidatus Micrarchaeota archaeon]|nr:hypothetical protein [Candidatus Micrarchaeota archaeon]